MHVVSITDAAETKVVPAHPSGSFTAPDAIIDDANPVDVAIEARGIPIGTVVELHLRSETDAPQIVETPPLEGTEDLSTATVSVIFPPGFTIGFARAVWRP